MADEGAVIVEGEDLGENIELVEGGENISF